MINEQVLAVVAGNKITTGDIEKALMSLGQRAKSYDNPQGRQMLLEQMINKKLLVADAQRSLYDRDSAFLEQLAIVKEELLANFVVDKLLSTIKITDDEVTKYYEENKETLVSSETVNANHILVDSQEKAAEIKKEIVEGQLTFEEAASKYSSCPSKEQGGSLGEFGKGQMVPEFEEACFNMEPGDVSDPVKTNFGYHLIRLNAKTKATQLELAEIKDQLKDQLLAEKQKNAYNSKINQLKILFPVERI